MGVEIAPERLMEDCVEVLEPPLFHLHSGACPAQVICGFHDGIVRRRLRTGSSHGSGGLCGIGAKRNTMSLRLGTNGCGGPVLRQPFRSQVPWYSWRKKDGFGPG